MKKTCIKHGHVVVSLTANEAHALFGLVIQANGQGDHYDWTKSAGGTPAELRAIRELMRIAHDANQDANILDRLNT